MKQPNTPTGQVIVKFSKAVPEEEVDRLIQSVGGTITWTCNFGHGVRAVTRGEDPESLAKSLRDLEGCEDAEVELWVALAHR